MARGTRISGVAGPLVVLSLGSLCLLWAARAFVQPGIGLRGKAGREPAASADFSSVRSTELSTFANGEQDSIPSAIQASMLSAVVGITLGVTPPAWAEQDGEIALEGGDPGAQSVRAASSRKKSKRAGGAAEPSARQVERQQAEASGAKAPTVSFTQEGPKKQKVIFSPADDIDDDEKSYWAPNPPLLAFFFVFPVALYLFFYVAGSLDII
eukprot:TRINITY_DN4306_c0_g1_i3.p1 TRINITY_DN4306_c0_g1~~TRINITY_DN4306_c0_g1_i3.p1  ORF type:complete len:227 (+),score=51.97 TRINITY_DN4306_c0_g1_i3:49-681(+)